MNQEGMSNGTKCVEYRASAQTHEDSSRSALTFIPPVTREMVSFPSSEVMWTKVSLNEAKMWATPKTSSPSLTCWRDKNCSFSMDCALYPVAVDPPVSSTHLRSERDGSFLCDWRFGSLLWRLFTSHQSNIIPISAILFPLCPCFYPPSKLDVLDPSSDSCTFSLHRSSIDDRRIAGVQHIPIRGVYAPSLLTMFAVVMYSTVESQSFAVYQAISRR